MDTWMMTSSLIWSTTLFLIISDFGRTCKHRPKQNIVHKHCFVSADVKIATNLHSKDLVFKVVFHSNNGSIWSFRYEAQDLRVEMQSVSVTSRLRLTRWTWGTLWRSPSGNVQCGNSGRKTEFKSTSVVWALSPGGRRTSGAGGPQSAEKTAEWPSLWVMESLMIDRKPTLRRRSAAAPRFCGRHLYYFSKCGQSGYAVVHHCTFVCALLYINFMQFKDHDHLNSGSK